MTYEQLDDPLDHIKRRT